MSRHIAFARLHNFRDLGGYRGFAGRTVRWGRLYRSDALSKMDDADWARFLELGVKTVIDLRYPFEIDRRGRVREHDGLAYHNLSVEHRPYRQAELGPEVETGPFLAGKYVEVAQDGVVELRQALDVIAADENAPVVFHCASGKDRTRLLAALVLTLLDVPDEVIVEDFALTELATAGLVADITALMGVAPTWPGYGRAPADVMILFLAWARENHESLRGYAEQRLGIDDEYIARLRANLLEP
ncbi:tyrosine-protein phosphatase [Catellatospora vulcania]|uniref:tyrosine-protein phosphatase n=1 Tax=Catellatospora vulcania TaxID=1460450 RepID=UPI0012D3E738|nr:tyrosine-protein phosphatase [Catellatospora vulcania]